MSTKEASKSCYISFLYFLKGYLFFLKLKLVGGKWLSIYKIKDICSDPYLILIYKTESIIWTGVALESCTGGAERQQSDWQCEWDFIQTVSFLEVRVVRGLMGIMSMGAS